ncbi:MAG: hypothetical protein II954_02665 [Synergistaceae bacterium]|nr:hypothetical protein [Synergistaceae bacterium]
MSRPYYSVKHVESMALLPEKLTRGRAYFVDDEQVIVIDHGRGPVIYGGKPGPQGATGEPIPELQDQIDSLVQAELTTQKNLWELKTLHKEDINRLQDSWDGKAEHLQEQADLNAAAILSLIDTLQEKITQYDAAISTLAKTVANLYPANFNPEGGETNADPLDGEQITTDAGTWTIEQTILEDGSIVLNLSATELVIDTIDVGDSVGYDGTNWTVSSVTRNDDGTISLTLDQ